MTVAFATAVHVLVAQVMDLEPLLTTNMKSYLAMRKALALIPNATSSAYIT